MIIGNGLIANCVKPCDRENIILFASGVSNSVNPKEDDFKREESLVRDVAGRASSNQLFVYFSTISVYDKSVNQKPYILHKLEMEDLVKSIASSYLIIRLPNIFGVFGNPNTLFPHFKKSIENNSQVIIYDKALRYVLNTEQLKRMVQELIDANLKNEIINCVPNKAFTVLEIYNAMVHLLKGNSNYKLAAGGVAYEVKPNFNFASDINFSLNQLVQMELQESKV